MDPTIPGIKGSNLQREKCFFRNNNYFFCTPVNNFSNMLFQVLSIDRLGEIYFELYLIKVQIREEALSEII